MIELPDSQSRSVTPVKQYQRTSASGHHIIIKEFALADYQESLRAMTQFAVQRTFPDNSFASNSPDEPDQIWLLQHPPVYTQGSNCGEGTFLASEIPIVKTDRGGQITYHGPGQIVMYPLLYLRRYQLGVKAFVDRLEQAVIDVLSESGIVAVRRDDAPGVYINGAKIAALGLRVKRGTSYHGLSFNIDMELTPFQNIDPCGLKGLRVTQLSDLDESVNIEQTQQALLDRFLALI